MAPEASTHLAAAGNAATAYATESGNDSASAAAGSRQRARLVGRSATGARSAFSKSKLSSTASASSDSGGSCLSMLQDAAWALQSRPRQRGEQFADRERRLLRAWSLRPREEAFQVVPRVTRAHAVLRCTTAFGAGALALLAFFAAHGAACPAGRL